MHIHMVGTHECVVQKRKSSLMFDSKKSEKQRLDSNRVYKFSYGFFGENLNELIICNAIRQSKICQRQFL